MARAPVQIARPLNIGAPAGSPPLIGGGPISAALMNPQPMMPQGPGVAPPQFSRQFPGPGSAPLANAPQLPAAGPPAMAASASPGGGGMGSRIGDFLGSDAALALSAGILEGGTTSQALGRGMGYALAARQAANKPQATTDDIQEYAFAKQQGYTGSFTDFMTMTRKAGATQVNVGQSEYGTIPQGYQLRRGEDGSLSMSPIPGGPEDMSGKEAAAAETTARSANVVLQDIGRMKELVSASPGLTTGFGGAIMLNIPGSNAVNVKALTSTIGANIGFDRLQRMREESPTGGSLGQVSEWELELLQATLGSIDQAQSSEQLLENLDRLEQIYSDILTKAAAYPNAAKYGFVPPSPQEDWQDVGNGVRVRELP